MWTTENRCRYDRSKLRYPNDLTEQEWALIKPLIPRPREAATSEPSMSARSLMV
jgi:hypothetical protein